MKNQMGYRDYTIDAAINKLRAEYERAISMPFVKAPLAYALYQVWKEADREGK